MPSKEKQSSTSFRGQVSAEEKAQREAGGAEEYCKWASYDGAMMAFLQESNETKATTAAWVVMLRKKNYVIDLVPVKFSSYDEVLYQEIVKIDAVNGHVTLGANMV